MTLEVCSTPRAQGRKNTKQLILFIKLIFKEKKHKNMSILGFYGFLDKTISSGIVRLMHNELKDLYPLYLRQDSQRNGLEP